MTGPLRIERRLDTPKWLKLAVPLVSIVLAAIIVGILLAATGHNPFSTYHQMYSASVTADGALTSTFVYATPMLFTGLCAAFAFRMRTWNIGGEGQLYMGAVGASAIGLVLGDWPRPLLIIAMVVGRRPRRDAVGVHSRPPARLSAHERDPHLAHAQLRCRLLHVLPDLRQHLVLAGPDHARGVGVPDRQDAGGERHLAGDHHRVVHAADGLRPRRRLGRRPAPPHPLDPLRLRDAGHGRFAAGGQLRRHPHQTEDRLGDGDIRWDRRNRRLQPDRRLRARARSPRARTGAVRVYGHRRRGPRPLQSACRRARVAADRRPHERRLCPGGSLVPDRPCRHDGRDHPLHRPRRRDPRPLPDRPAASPAIAPASVGPAPATEMSS